METFLLFYALPILLTVLLTFGEPDRGEVIPFAIIPGINIVLAIISVVFFIRRAYRSKGKCIHSHAYSVVYDSEKEKWANGRMPMRISAGGFTRYHCHRCNENTSTSWSAF